MRSGSVCSRFCRLGNYANMSMKKIAIFHGFKSGNYQLKKVIFYLVSYFCSRHTLWVHVRTASLSNAF